MIIKYPPSCINQLGIEVKNNNNKKNNNKGVEGRGPPGMEPAT